MSLSTTSSTTSLLCSRTWLHGMAGPIISLASICFYFIRYCKEDTCYTLVDLCCTFDSYIVYHGSSKKVLTALVTLADCVGSLNRLSAVSRFSPR